MFVSTGRKSCATCSGMNRVIRASTRSSLVAGETISGGMRVGVRKHYTQTKVKKKRRASGELCGNVSSKSSQTNRIKQKKKKKRQGGVKKRGSGAARQVMEEARRARTRRTAPFRSESIAPRRARFTAMCERAST